MNLPAEESREIRRFRVQSSIIKSEQRKRLQLIKQSLMERGKQLANLYALNLDESIDNST